MFSQSIEYAMRAVVYLAQQDSSPRTTKQIAEATRLPFDYLRKVLRKLRRAGIVHCHQGASGGISLQKSPENLTLLEVASAIDPIRRSTNCPLGLAEDEFDHCPLQERLDEALALVQEALDQTTVAEVVAKQKPMRSV